MTKSTVLMNVSAKTLTNEDAKWLKEFTNTLDILTWGTFLLIAVLVFFYYKKTKNLDKITMNYYFSVMKPFLLVSAISIIFYNAFENVELLLLFVMISSIMATLIIGAFIPFLAQKKKFDNNEKCYLENFFNIFELESEKTIK